MTVTLVSSDLYRLLSSMNDFTKKMATLDLDACFDCCVGTAEAAGNIIRSAIKKKQVGNIETKESNVDLVTETDQRVERFIIGALRQKFPDHKFIGEESVAGGEKCELTDDPTWVIDPIDGTMNFVHGFPFVAVSIALLVKKEAELAVVHSAILEQTYTARRGKGAFCDGEKLEASGQEDLGKALLITEMGGDRRQEKLDCVYANLTSLLPQVHGIRALGSAALNMCLVASGVADVSYEFGIHCWDIAAGDLIVREAGGFVCDTEGGPLNLMHRRYICAGSKALASVLSEKLQQIILEHD